MQVKGTPTPEPNSGAGGDKQPVKNKSGKTRTYLKSTPFFSTFRKKGVSTTTHVPGEGRKIIRRQTPDSQKQKKSLGSILKKFSPKNIKKTLKNFRAKKAKSQISLSKFNQSIAHINSELGKIDENLSNLKNPDKTLKQLNTLKDNLLLMEETNNQPEISDADREGLSKNIAQHTIEKTLQNLILVEKNVTLIKTENPSLKSKVGKGLMNFKANVIHLKDDIKTQAKTKMKAFQNARADKKEHVPYRQAQAELFKDLESVQNKLENSESLTMDEKQQLRGQIRQLGYDLERIQHSEVKLPEDSKLRLSEEDVQFIQDSIGIASDTLTDIPTQERASSREAVDVQPKRRSMNMAKVSKNPEKHIGKAQQSFTNELGDVQTTLNKTDLFEHEKTQLKERVANLQTGLDQLVLLNEKVPEGSRQKIDEEILASYQDAVNQCQDKMGLDRTEAVKPAIKPGPTLNARQLNFRFETLSTKLSKVKKQTASNQNPVSNKGIINDVRKELEGMRANDQNSKMIDDDKNFTKKIDTLFTELNTISKTVDAQYKIEKDSAATILEDLQTELDAAKDYEDELLLDTYDNYVLDDAGAPTTEKSQALKQILKQLSDIRTNQDLRNLFEMEKELGEIYTKLGDDASNEQRDLNWM